MPVALAFVAGGLATVNPCGFALLPALLSFYLGGDSSESRRSGVIEALRIGGVVAAGILGVFLSVGVPITLGASHIVQGVPWAGVATGVVLVVAGAVMFSGRHVSLPLRSPVRPGQSRRARSMLAFGIAYGVASLGCTLPIFLSVVGASLATRGSAAALVVLSSYAVGMLAVVIALSIAAAFARDGLARRLRGLAPRMQRIGAVTLTVAGAYLTYYWARVLWGPVTTLAQDPIVGRVQRVAAALERLAAGNGRWIVGMAAGIVILSLALVLLRRKSSTEPGDGQATPSHSTAAPARLP